MRVSVPTGAIGVDSKEYISSMALKVDRFRLVVNRRIMFRICRIDPLFCINLTF